MSTLLSIIPIAEKQFVDYLAGTYEGDYPIRQACRTGSFDLPLILVKAGQLSELSPGTQIYQGSLMVSVLTQVDDEEDPVTTHEEAVGQIEQALADQTTLLASVNEEGDHFLLFGYYLETHDSERQERALISTWEFNISCQLHSE